MLITLLIGITTCLPMGIGVALIGAAGGIRLFTEERTGLLRLPIRWMHSARNTTQLMNLKRRILDTSQLTYVCVTKPRNCLAIPDTTLTVGGLSRDSISEYLLRRRDAIMKNKSNPTMLIVCIFLAWLPEGIIWFRINGWTVTAAALVAFAWLIVAIRYYRRIRTKSALWIFVLLPVAFGPLIFGLLIVIGVVLSRGRW
jgi:hypothetical protein